MIESCWPIINSLGERFIYYRCVTGDSFAKVWAALTNSSKKGTMREEMQAASALVLSQPLPKATDMTDATAMSIAHMADFVAKARSPVKREGRTEEISYSPAAEVGTRLGGQLIQLARGITVARGQETCDELVMRVVSHVAVSGIPRLRWQLIAAPFMASAPQTTADLGQQLRIGSGSASTRSVLSSK